MHDDEVKQFKISTKVGDITVKSDPTLKPDEIRRERPPVNPMMVTATGAAARITCARCSHPFTSSPDGFIDEALETEIAAHQERCVIVGDYVRWERPSHKLWADGTLVSITDDGHGCYLNVESCGGKWRFDLLQGEHRFDGPFWKSVSLRRIPRPQQGDVAPDKLDADHAHEYAADYARRCREAAKSVPRVTVKLTTPTGCTKLDCTPGEPLFYDGLTAMQCYMRWADNRAIVERGGASLHAMTEVQIAAGRAAHLAADGHLRSAQLRAKLAASAEAERCRVRVEDQSEP